MPPWLQAWHKVKVTSKFQQICWLLTIEIVVLEHILIQIHNNTYIIGFYHFTHVSYTFGKAELVKATLDFAPKRLASLYFCTIFLTCH